MSKSKSTLNLFKLRPKLKNNSGIILVIVLWILIILTFLAVALGRQTSIELALTKNAISRVKAKYLAWAGIHYSLDQIRLDTEDTDSNVFDTLNYCGILNREDVTLEDLFLNVKLQDGQFTVGYIDNLGIIDEERKININALNVQTVIFLSGLIEVNGFDSQVAQTISYSAMDWIDQDTTLSNIEYGAEAEYYQQLEKPYKVKNAPFNSIEELLLVRGMTEDIFKAIKDDITIYPVAENLRVNFNTASEKVLKALIRPLTGGATNTDIVDADSLVDKILVHRRGDDGVEPSSDDKQVEMNEINLIAKEQVLMLAMLGYQSQLSNYLRIRSTGHDAVRGVKATFEAVIRRSDLQIIYWHRL